MAVLTALAVHHPPPPRDLNPAVPKALSHLIDRMLAKTVAHRPASAADVLHTLATIEAGLATNTRANAVPPGHAGAATRAVPLRRTTARAAGLLAAALLGLTGIVLFVVVSGSGRRPPADTPTGPTAGSISPSRSRPQPGPRSRRRSHSRGGRSSGSTSPTRPWVARPVTWWRPTSAGPSRARRPGLPRRTRPRRSGP